MAFPSDIAIGQNVQYLPAFYDMHAFNRGYPGPVAALITWIDAEAETIGLLIFPDGKAPLHRKEIKYFADADPEEDSFKKITDVLTCSADVADEQITDFNSSNFTIIWEPVLGNSAGVSVRYRINGGDPTWLLPNAIGTLEGHFSGPGNDTFIFTNMAAGTTYDVQIRNLCLNNIYSAGVVVTGTAITPP